ncbi:hypothetical protein [Streptomyces sp. NPDC059593]|uniref:hypothetical protein n=1 Tax=Streptomyces sp. NPDC059593 TaxID=3346878 RepID=UPI0036ADA340
MLSPQVLGKGDQSTVLRPDRSSPPSSRRPEYSSANNEHTTSYGSNRSTAEIHVVHDAEKPQFSAAVEPLYSTIVKHVLGGGVSLAILALGLWGVLAPYI